MMKRNICLLFLLSLLFVGAVWAGAPQVIKVYSPSMKKQVEAVVVAPKDKSVRHPVVYLLHGAYSNDRKWLEVRPDLPRVADSLGVIFVTPEAYNTCYFDSPMHKNVRYETFLSTELIDYMDSHYATIPNRSGRAIMGLSMGGHGALFTAFRHKDIFGACGSMSGGVDFRPFPDQWFIKNELGEEKTHQEVWDRHVVVNNLDGITNHDLAIIIDCGESDFFLRVNKELHQKLLNRGIDHDFIVRPGGHNNEYWANSFDYQMLFFKKFFERCQSH